MTVYYNNLTFDIDLLKRGCIVTDLAKVVNGKKTYHSLINIKEYINPDMVKLLAEIGIDVYYCELFYSPPSFFSQIHIDANAVRSDFTKINWVFGGKDSVMNWYKPKHDTDRPVEYIPANKLPYKSYQQQEVDLLYSANLKTPSVVQVGIPHNITNFSEDRYCISLALASINNNEIYRPTMEESLTLLSKYLAPTYGIEPQSPAS